MTYGTAMICLQVYYKYNTKEDTQPFPEVRSLSPRFERHDSLISILSMQGFRMMGGQSMARSYNPPPGADPFYTYFECLGDGIAVSS
jgi:hypothetical protein